MSRDRTIALALRLAAFALLAVSVVLGPAGLGALAVGSDPCGAECPCDEAAHDDHAGEHDDAALGGANAEADPAHRDGEPCEGECPDGCPDCSCWHGMAAAVLSSPVTSSAASWIPAELIDPVSAPPDRSDRGVFRPPRSLI